ncbi:MULTISPECIES: MarC family protein [Pseudomonas]|uniref:UPF0056 membrane protein n=1 Tax=Pseudomonas segetis TaxID=298908 RepID=A0A239CFM8_9PSED|nr:MULTISPECIES: MarC family protein [Pseudomonas]SNS18264.1 multiple antibiotic resistance protein [Pseudomonas segetis]
MGMEMDMYGRLITIFLGFFAITNPIPNTAVFAGLTRKVDKAERYRIAVKSTLIAFGVVVFFSLLGKTLFHLLGITLPALRITGGILVFIIGYQMLQGYNSTSHSEDDGDTDIAVSPIAVPILVGPGTIATAMNYSASEGSMGAIMTISMYALLGLITFFCFIFSARVVAIIGGNGLKIITQLMGLILAVIGIQLLIAGIYEVVTMTGDL